MPTSHGIAAVQGPRPGRATTRSTSPGCGPPARCRSARRRRRSSARCNFTKTRRGASPATRGTRPHARRVERRHRRPRSPPGWSVRHGERRRRLDPHPGRRSPGSSASRPASAASPTRAPTRSQTASSGRSRRPSPTPPVTSTSRPGPTTATARRCPPPDVSLRGCDRVARRGRAPGPLVARPRVRGGRSRGGGHRPGRRRGPRRARPGWRLDDEPVHLTDPVKHVAVGGVRPTSGSGSTTTCGRRRRRPHRTTPARCSKQTAEYPLPRFARTLRAAGPARSGRGGRLFADVDVLLTPTTAVPAFAAEGPPPSMINGDAVHPAMSTPFTMLANLCWNPSISVPAGRTADGLPVGLQITARRHRDDVALRLARLFELAQPWPRFAPSAELRRCVRAI